MKTKTKTVCPLKWKRGVDHMTVTFDQPPDALTFSASSGSLDFFILLCPSEENSDHTCVSAMSSWVDKSEGLVDMVNLELTFRSPMNKVEKNMSIYKRGLLEKTHKVLREKADLVFRLWDRMS